MWLSNVLFLDKVFPHTSQVKEFVGASVSGTSDTVTALGAATSAVEASEATDVELDDETKGSVCNCDLNRNMEQFM